VLQGGRELKETESLLRLTIDRIPVCLFEVRGEGAGGILRNSFQKNFSVGERLIGNYDGVVRIRHWESFTIWGELIVGFREMGGVRRVEK